VAVAVTQGRIETRDGRRWWSCPNCGQKLGEVVGTRIVMITGARQIRMPVDKEPEYDCPRCEQASRLMEAA